MPTSFYFGGRKIIRPGVYSRITSGRQNPPLTLDYGTLLILDNTANDGLTNNGIRGGAGIAGEHSQNVDSIYGPFTNIQDFREFVGYGWWWKAADFLFNPNGSNPGVSQIYIVKPATTTSATMTFTATGGGSAGGTFKFDTRDEGVAANGTLTSTKLTSGYAYTIETGVVDNAKWIFKVWRGNYKGAYVDSIAYDEVAQSISDNSPTLLVQSPEFNNIQNLIDWANTDPVFGSYFILDPTSAKTGAGTVTQADITPLSGYQVAASGTATYDKMDAALEAVRELPYNWVMYTVSDPTTVHSDTNILKIKTHILTQAKYDKFLMVGGSDDTLTESLTSTASLNSDRITLVHGGIYKVSQATSSGFRNWFSFFHACMVLGRICGLPPQVPITDKALDIDKLQASLTPTEQERALLGGILTTVWDPTRREFIVLQGVNTLQNNSYQLNPDGTSFSIQLRRIAAQLNAELIVNARLQLMSDPLGVNRNTLSEKDLVEWVKSYLGRKLATDTQDNLIVSFQNVTAIRDQDAYFVTYQFEANSEINKLFLTGFML
ncbi:MAG: hypothetical protein LLF83_08355 [Methanobacterium sp.]|nr:hypothetical protein [Methanobacterium sp.]